MSPAMATAPVSSASSADLHVQPPDAVERSTLMQITINERAAESVPACYVLPAQLRPLPVCPIQIPLIDLAQLISHADDPGDCRADTLAGIHRACCDWGFFQVLNHGVSLHALNALRGHLHEFFALPTSAKCKLGLVKGDDGQGYGSGFVDPKAGAVEWKDYLLFHTHPPYTQDYHKWPSSLRDDVKLVAEQMLKLSRHLLACLSENLHLPPSAIEDAMDVLHQKILIAHYPPCPQPDLAMGSCEHTDVGVITCVWQASEDVVGLQVSKDGQWHSVEPHPGAIVVNIGDQIEILSNGLYKSGPHRVVLNKTKSRLSFVAFHNPSAAAVVSPAAALVDDDHPPVYEPTSFKAYAAKFSINAV